MVVAAVVPQSVVAPSTAVAEAGEETRVTVARPASAVPPTFPAPTITALLGVLRL